MWVWRKSVQWKAYFSSERKRYFAAFGKIFFPCGYNRYTCPQKLLYHNDFRGHFFFFFFFFHSHYSPLLALACRTMSFHFFLSATNSLHLLTPNTWRSLSTSSFHLSLGLPLLLVPYSSWVKIFLGILSCSILSRWPNQLILCPFIHFTIFSPFLISSSSRFVRLFNSPFSYLGPYNLLNIFLSKIRTACSSLFVNVYASAPYVTTGLISVLYNTISVCVDKSFRGQWRSEVLPALSALLVFFGCISL